MHFGEKIRSLRKDRKWNQPEFAEAIGIEQSYLSKIENGKSIPSAEIFQMMLQQLDLSIGQLLEDVDPAIIHRQLRQIPEVNAYLLKKEGMRIKRTKTLTISVLVNQNILLS